MARSFQVKGIHSLVSGGCRDLAVSEIYRIPQHKNDSDKAKDACDEVDSILNNFD